MAESRDISKVDSVEDLGTFVRTNRKHVKLTQVEAARSAGVGPRFLGELEKGKETVRLGTVLQVLDALGLELVVRRIDSYSRAGSSEGRVVVSPDSE